MTHKKRLLYKVGKCVVVVISRWRLITFEVNGTLLLAIFYPAGSNAFVSSTDTTTASTV